MNTYRNCKTKRNIYTVKNKSNKSNKSSKNSKTIVCKIYANWCGHCESLKPVWAELKNIMNADKNILMMEIEESEMKAKIGKLKNICKKDIDVNGFPTIVKICVGKNDKSTVEYYQGERSVDGLRAWISQPKMKGGKGKKGKNKTRRQN